MARTARQLPDSVAQPEAAAEWRNIDTLDFWDGNPRDNDAAALVVAELIIEYGFGAPMMAWPDPKKKNPRIIAGNTRKKSCNILLARYKELLRDSPAELKSWHPGAIRLAKTRLVPVRIRTDLTEDQATELALADNKSNELATWDRDLLAKLLRNLPSGKALTLGWSDGELARILRVQHPIVDVEPNVERADELAKEWKVKTGQLWRCGVHLILCGDTRNSNDVSRVMGGMRAVLTMNDPPYGVDIGAKNRMLNSIQKSGRNLSDIEDDALDFEKLRDVLTPAFRNIQTLVMAEDCTSFTFGPCGGDVGLMIQEMLRDVGMPAKHILIWKKNQPTFSMGRLDYDYKHEPILMGWGKKHKRPMQGEQRTSVWEIDRPRASPDHPTPKPPELYCNALLNNSDEGDVAFDGYGGSGTLIIACEQTRRIARVIEISPGYVAVTLQRWLEATKQQPELVT